MSTNGAGRIGTAAGTEEAGANMTATRREPRLWVPPSRARSKATYWFPEPRPIRTPVPELKRRLRVLTETITTLEHERRLLIRALLGEAEG
jgi:hypothetical protein